MKKPWSISTTVRNAERIRPFLEVLDKMRGEVFNEDGQVKFQTLLIQHKLYKPIGLSQNLLRYYSSPKDEMSYEEAEQIFDFMKSQSRELREDPGLRGRTSVAPLSKMGLCIARKSEGEVKITEIGKDFLEEKIDIGDVFFKFLLKWQYPNPESDDFKSEDGFAIKPFIGTLHLINTVNQKWRDLGNKSKGVSKEEFSLFVPTLINFRDIKEQAEGLIDFRLKVRQITDAQKQKEFKERFKNNFARKFLGTNDSRLIRLLIKNLRDYGDNTIRYFRLTRFIYIRGGGFYVDLEPRRQLEISKLLVSDNAEPIEFNNIKEYRNFLVDINQPILPWEEESELKKIAFYINSNTKQYLKDLKNKRMLAPSFKYKNIEALSKEELKLYIEELRSYRREIQEIEVYFESQSIDKIKEYAGQLINIYSSKVKHSIELERLVTLALNALDDASSIKPNYPVGDDNEPTFTAPPNKPDIECFYVKFNCVCEVTTLTDRSQWFNEGQPVMRHARDFENIHKGKDVYCLFIAPRLHRDTINTFWASVKYGYEGSKQKIIPLTIKQLVDLLEVLLDSKQKGKNIKHTELLSLYDEILRLTKTIDRPDLWLEKIPHIISRWKHSVLSD